MPRLTAHEFIKRHHFLRILWLDDRSQAMYALLPVHQQWELHDCYLPADALTDEELEAHFINLKRSRSNLLLQAGRHYAVLYRAVLAGSHQSGSVSISKGKVAVRFVARPHIDEEALAAALAIIASHGDVIDKDLVE